MATGGKKAGGDLEAGYFFEPTVLTECTLEMKVLAVRIGQRRVQSHSEFAKPLLCGPPIPTITAPAPCCERLWWTSFLITPPVDNGCAALMNAVITMLLTAT